MKAKMEKMMMMTTTMVVMVVFIGMLMMMIRRRIRRRKGRGYGKDGDDDIDNEDDDEGDNAYDVGDIDEIIQRPVYRSSSHFFETSSRVKSSLKWYLFGCQGNMYMLFKHPMDRQLSPIRRTS